MKNYNLIYYVRVDAQGNLVPGSGVLRQSQPKFGMWIALDENLCCQTSSTSTSSTTSSTTTTTTTLG
jgi:hypothetical protein